MHKSHPCPDFGLGRGQSPSENAESRVETVRTNLTGGRATLAVPRYMFDAGIKTIDDLGAHKSEFDGKIYGISPGSNEPIKALIRDNVGGLGSWNLVESSEGAMLAQVERSIRRKEPVVWFGWEPHPMNLLFQMAYLSGGEDQVGPNYGASSVLTDVRRGYLSRCQNVGRLLKNLVFSVDAEDRMMLPVLAKDLSLRESINQWLKANPGWLVQTLDGVDTVDGQSGQSGLLAVQNFLRKRK